MESGEFMKKVLIVDDQMAIRRLLLEVLKDNFEVCLACSGEEAIEMGGKCKPDIILLDIGLPGISGIDALPQLKQEVPGCSIYMLTGSSDAMLIERALSLGAAGFIEKPFDILKVREKLISIS